MATIPTQNAVPSEAPRDLKFNSGKIDEFVTSLEHEYKDRFGRRHMTIEGMRWVFEQLMERFKVDVNQAIVAAGYIPMDSFQQGAEITKRNEILRDETTGEYYRWDGDLPKSVPAGATPESSGGVGIGAWVGVGDASLRSDLSSDSGNFGDSLVAVKQPFFGAVRRTQHDKNTDIITSADFGIIPSAGVDMTEEMQKAFNHVTSTGQVITILPGEYLISTVELGKAVNVYAVGAVFKLTPEGTGFHAHGITDSFRWVGGEIVGTGGFDDGRHQTGITVSTNQGDAAKNVLIRDVAVNNTNIGIKVAYGTSPFVPTDNVHIENCSITKTNGTEGGNGYAIQISHAPRTTLIANKVSQYSRHGIYISSGEKAIVTGNQIQDGGHGEIRGAINIDRTRDFIASSNIMINNNDVGFLANADGQSEFPNVSSRGLIFGNNFINNKIGGCQIGYLDPDSGFPTNITVSNNAFIGHDDGAAEIRVWSGKNITVSGNNLKTSGTAINVRNFGKTAETQTDFITLKSNVIDTQKYGIEFEGGFETGNMHVNATENTFIQSIEPIRFVDSPDNITNPNLIYQQKLGVSSKRVSVDSSSVCVAGNTVIHFAQPGGNEITNLTGQVRGQKIVFIGTNGNTTLKKGYFKMPADVGGSGITLRNGTAVNIIIGDDNDPIVVSYIESV